MIVAETSFPTEPLWFYIFWFASSRGSVRGKMLQKTENICENICSGLKEIRKQVCYLHYKVTEFNPLLCQKYQSRKFSWLDLEITETSCPPIGRLKCIYFYSLSSLSLHCRMFSKSARSRLSACWWAACARGGSSSSSSSRRREAPAGKAWTSWTNPPPRQTSAMSTCEPPEGIVARDLQKKKASWKKTQFS